MSELLLKNLDEKTKEALVGEMLCLGDTMRVLGHWYIMVLPNGRSLLDFNALASMIQEELGHCRAVYNFLENVGESAYQLEIERSVDDLRSMSALDQAPLSWTDFIVAIDLVEHAIWKVAETFINSKSEEIHGLVSRIGQEEYFHQLYTSGWMRILSAENPDELTASIQRHFPTVLQWFGRDEDEDVLLTQGLRSRSVQKARQSFIGYVKELILKNNIKMDADKLVAESEQQLDWSTWIDDYHRPNRNGPGKGLKDVIRCDTPEFVRK